RATTLLPAPGRPISATTLAGPVRANASTSSIAPPRIPGVCAVTASLDRPQARIVAPSNAGRHDLPEAPVPDPGLPDHQAPRLRWHGDGVAGDAGIAVAPGRGQGARRRTCARRGTGASLRERGARDRPARAPAHRRDLRRGPHLERPALLHGPLPAARRPRPAQ